MKTRENVYRDCLACFEEERMIGEHLCKNCLVELWSNETTFIQANEVREEWKKKC